MAVLTCAETGIHELQQLLGKYQIQLISVDATADIPGSWFGAPEAGLIDNRLYVRADTPVHSALHESCHYICMPAERRNALHTNAGGDYDEENAVCFLSILLSDYITDFGRERMFKDMDEWGYTFRLGSSKAWFEQDAEDAQQWLRQYKLTNQQDQPNWILRV